MRFYVTMTWDNWPEGGSFGTVVEAETHEEAAELCRGEMALSRADDDENDPEHYLENYSRDWHEVDCFDLDEFITHHHL